MVAVYESSPGQRERVSLIAPVRLEDWHRLSRTFTAISGSYAESVTDTSGAEPERLDGRRVMPRFFESFGMAPLAGRTFVADEERFGGSPAVVISEGFWMRRFARRAGAIGARLTVGGTGYTIVGVMPRAFTPAATDVWVPAQLSPALMRIREARFLTGVARMKPGVTLAEAQADLSRVQTDARSTVSRLRQGMVRGCPGHEGGPRRRVPPSAAPRIQRRRAAVRDRRSPTPRDSCSCNFTAARRSSRSARRSAARDGRSSRP